MPRKPTEFDVMMQFTQLSNPVNNAAKFQSEVNLDFINVGIEISQQEYDYLRGISKLTNQRMIDICWNMERLVNTIVQQANKRAV